MTLNLVFSVLSWDETEIKHIQKDVFKQASARYQYRGDFEAESDIEFVLLYKSEDLAVFSAVEQIKGEFKGQSFELVLAHQGLHSQGVAQGQCHVQHAEGALSAMIDTQGAYQANSASVELTLS